MPVLPPFESNVSNIIIVDHRDGVTIRYRKGFPNAPEIITDAPTMTLLAKSWLEACGYEVIQRPIKAP